MPVRWAARRRSAVVAWLASNFARLEPAVALLLLFRCAGTPRPVVWVLTPHAPVCPWLAGGCALARSFRPFFRASPAPAGTGIITDKCPPAGTPNDAQVKGSSRAYCDEIVARGVACTVGKNCQTNGAKWYELEGSLQDWEFHAKGTLSLTMEVSSWKRPMARTLPNFYDNHEKAIGTYMLWPTA